MGTPDFAVPSLDILLQNHYDIAAVITAPDKPSGRGLQVNESPVKKYAREHNLTLLQPANLKDENFLRQLQQINPNLQVVVAFRMLPEVVWKLPALGTFNLHASLLPQYRGAAPIHWAIINGETQTGCTTFFLRHEIDSGDILLSQPEPIYPSDTFGSLYERLKIKGAQLVLDTVKAIEQDNIKPIPQPLCVQMKFAPKLNRDNTKINWQLPAHRIYNVVRGLNPIPAAWTDIFNIHMKIFDVKIIDQPSHLAPQQYITDNKTYLHVGTGDSAIAITELQAEGKKRMFIEEYLRGNKL